MPKGDGVDLADDEVAAAKGLIEAWMLPGRDPRRLSFAASPVLAERPPAALATDDGLDERRSLAEEEEEDAAFVAGSSATGSFAPLLTCTLMSSAQGSSTPQARNMMAPWACLRVWM